jgi:hypothetical protein
MLWESCSYSYTEHNKIGIAIFGFFYNFISNLQDTVKTLKKWRILLRADPCQLLKVHIYAIGLPHRTPTAVARSPVASWGSGRQTLEQGVRLDSLAIDWRRRFGQRCHRRAAAVEQWRRGRGSSDSGEKRGAAEQCAARVASMCPREGARWIPGLREPAEERVRRWLPGGRPQELGLRRAGRSVRPIHPRVSSMHARRRFRRAQTAMEVGGAMSSPRGCQWWAAELGRRLGVRARQRPGRSTYSRGRLVVSGWGHAGDTSTCGKATAWPAMCVPRRLMARRGWCAGPVDRRHLARPTCHERHGGVHAVAAQWPVVTPAPRRAHPTWVRHVRQSADMATRDITAEHAPTFTSKNNLLSRFSKFIFSTFWN